MKLFISVKGEFHIIKRMDVFFVGWIKPGISKSADWNVWGQIKWDGYQGRKENLSHPRGFGPTDAGNSGEQTVYWKCKSTWKPGFFYQTKYILM